MLGTCWPFPCIIGALGNDLAMYLGSCVVEYTDYDVVRNRKCMSGRLVTIFCIYIYLLLFFDCESHILVNVFICPAHFRIVFCSI